MKVFFDGGCRPDPWGMETAVVIGGRTYVEQQLGPGTSMAAEWLALLRAASLAHALQLDDPLLLGDALAVIAQAQGRARCPPAFAPYLATWRASERQVGPLRLRHIKRTQNLAGIALARSRAGLG